MEGPPGTIYSQRLVLRLNDPDDDEDCWKLVKIYNDEGGDLGGITRVGIKTPEDVRRKTRESGPKQKYCTKSAAPKGLWHLVFLKDDNGNAGEFIGSVSMSFRSTMPWPDIGYAFLQPFWGRGYGSEAGRTALKWWQEEIGVTEVWTGALQHNLRSQKCAENIGFVRCGEVDFCFGTKGKETWITGPAFILPGMKWKQYDENGKRPFARATVGADTDV